MKSKKTKEPVDNKARIEELSDALNRELRGTATPPPVVGLARPIRGRVQVVSVLLPVPPAIELQVKVPVGTRVLYAEVVAGALVLEVYVPRPGVEVAHVILPIAVVPLSGECPYLTHHVGRCRINGQVHHIFVGGM